MNKFTHFSLSVFIATGLFQPLMGKTEKKVNSQPNSTILSLDDLAGHWMKVKTLRNLPSVNNFHGGLKTTRDISAVEFLTFPPFSQGGQSAITSINGKKVPSQESRWFPYQVIRRSTQDGLKITSTTRMVYEKEGVLISLQLENLTQKTLSPQVKLNLFGRVRKFDTAWNWDAPRPRDGAFLATHNQGQPSILISDKKSNSCIAYAFAPTPKTIQTTGEQAIATWKFTIPAGQSITLNYVMAVGENPSKVTQQSEQWAKNFQQTFKAAKDLWSNRWHAAFTPNNKQFSGHLPTLVTDDKKIKRIYYMGIVSALQLYRTNLPKSDKVFVTAGPQWAVTLTYFWDVEMWSTTWAMLEPASMKQQLKDWLAMDYHRCYARDYMTGKGSGPWYAANDSSIFTCIDSYLRTTGDKAFLKEKINGKTLLTHLKDISTHYQKLIRKGDVLADYGGSRNLLECVPTYINRVPSLNAANVSMLRETAYYYEISGDKNEAKKLRLEADRLLPEVLKLYVPKQGVWCSLHRDGKKVEMRHVFDFILVGQALSTKLSPSMKKEMISFVEKELLTKNWMRAQSLSDIAAKHSDRPDHGPMGSYDAWPALTIDVMCLFHHFDKALSFLHRTEEVIYEGPYTQSHEFLGRDKNATLRIANRGGQDYNEVCGTSFSDVIIRSFFGYRPELSEKINLLSPKTPRGFTGELLHLPHHGKLYTLKSDSNGVQMIKEKK